MNLTEHSDHYELGLAGADVTQIQIDYAFSLTLEESGHRPAREEQKVSIRIEKVFTYDCDGHHHDLDPVRDPVGLGPALVLARTSVESAVVGKDGSIEIRFANGAILRVVTDGQYEAWTLAAGNGLLLVGGPEEWVSIFRPQPYGRGTSQ